MESTHKYHYVYQTKNLINGKTYIGVHSTNDLDDGYIGCGVYGDRSNQKCLYAFPKAVKKYGYENFEKEILSFYDTAEEAYEEEKFLVTEEWVDSKDNYNIAVGGIGGWYHVNKDRDRYIPRGKDHPSSKLTGELNHFYGKKHTQEVIEYLRKINTGKKASKKTREKMSKNHPRLSGEDHPMYGRKHKKESKERVRKANLERHSTDEGKLLHIKAFKNVKKVINIESGKIFICAKDAAKETDIEYRKFIKMLKNNEINYKYYNE